MRLLHSILYNAFPPYRYVIENIQFPFPDCLEQTSIQICTLTLWLATRLEPFQLLLNQGDGTPTFEENPPHVVSTQYSSYRTKQWPWISAMTAPKTVSLVGDSLSWIWDVFQEIKNAYPERYLIDSIQVADMSGVSWIYLLVMPTSFMTNKI